MFTLDANIFVRDVDIRDPHHSTCHALLEALHTRRTPLICPHILLPEVAGAVRRTWQDALRGRLAAQFVGELPNLTLVAVDAALAQEAADLAADYALRGMDAIYVAVARRYGCTLVTLDDDPHRRAGTIVTVLTPADALARIPAPPADTT
ncbi:MAG: type II toxin-antitoxin system VapC family toxin [Roseiflexaceae bacterium]